MFTTASLLTLTVAVLHTTGLANDPFNDDWAAAVEAMRAANIDVGPMNMTFHGVFVGLWLQVGVLLALLGVKNLAVLLATPADGAHRVIRVLSAIDCIAYAGLTAIFTVVIIPPALVSFAVLTLAFLIAAILSRGAESQ